MYYSSPDPEVPEYHDEETELAFCAFHAADISTGSEGLDHREYDMNHLVGKPYCVHYYCNEKVPLVNMLK